MSTKYKKGMRELRSGWRWHTLPHRVQCSTICALGLNFRVRDGTGCTPKALITNTRQPLTPLSCARLSACRINNQPNVCGATMSFRNQVKPATPYHILGKPSTISTGQLHTFLRFHLPPIKLVVS